MRQFGAVLHVDDERLRRRQLPLAGTGTCDIPLHPYIERAVDGLRAHLETRANQAGIGQCGQLGSADRITFSGGTMTALDETCWATRLRPGRWRVHVRAAH